MSTFSRPLVISGPSGTGKSTLLNKLFMEHPDKFGFSVSHTTRKPRPGEKDGKDYYFVDRDSFSKLLNEGAFIEHAEFSGNMYGTSFMTVKTVQEAGKRCILDIEAQGVKQIKQSTLNPVYLFISPPNLSALESRLEKRGTENEESIRNRMQIAQAEIEYAKTGAHDMILVNNDLETAYRDFERIALGEIVSNEGLPPSLS